MSERQPYTYVILRYRHDPISGEQLNVGLVLHSAKRHFLGARIRKAYGRISKTFPDLRGSDFRHDMTAIENAFARIAAGEGKDLLSSLSDAGQLGRKVVADDDGALVWSEVRSGSTDDPQVTLDALFHRFVSYHDDGAGKHRTDADVWRPVRDRLVERRLADIFERKIIRSPHDEVQFEHAWKNGAWRCFQPLSFDLATPDGIQEKAARWAGHMVGLAGSREVFRPYFVVGKPDSDQLMRAYERALGLLASAPMAPEIIREEQLPAFLDHLEDKIREHQAAL